MKIKKIKWINVIKLILFLFCICMIVHDLYMMTIHSWVTHTLYGWTWLGIYTFILFCFIAGAIYEDFEEQTKSIPSYQPQHTRDTIR